MTSEYARVSAIMIDCHDPEALMAFWGEIVDVEVATRFPGYVFSTKMPGNHIGLAFQKVPEDKTTKNRLHLDLRHPDPDAMIAKIEKLGGARLKRYDMGGVGWTVMTDPEGNEFCIVNH